MSNDLNINIIAKDQTAPGLSSVDHGLQQTGGEAEKLIDKIQRVKTEADKVGTTTGFKAIASEADQAGRHVDQLNKKMGEGAKQNTLVLQNLGRVISDMPYGVMGVANNIEQLAGSWGSATAAAGGTRAAINGIIGAMSGPAGLLMVGIPVVTALAVAFGDDLVKAVSSGSESVEQLKQKLEGIQQYKDFDLSIRIAGLEGIARLKAELDMLIAKKAYLEGSQRVDKAVTDAPRWNIVSAMTNPLGYALLTQGAERERQKARTSQATYYTSAAQRIAAGKLDLGEDENVRYLTQYLRMSETAARNKLARNEVNWSISEKNAQIGLAQTKEDTKGSKSGASGASAASKIQREAEQVQRENERLLEQFDTLVASGDELAKINEQYGDNLALIDKVMRRGLISAAQYANGLKAIEQVKADAILRAAKSNKALNEELDSLFNGKAGVSMFGLSDREIQQRDKDRQDRMVTGIQSVGSILQDQGIKIRGFDQFAGAYTSFSKVTQLLDDKSTDTASITLNRITGYAQLASGIGEMIGGGIGSAISSTAGMAATGATIGTALAAGGGPIGAIIGGVVGLASAIFGGGSNEKEAKANRDNMRHQLYDEMVKSALSGGTESLKLLRAGNYDYDKVKNLSDPGYKGIKRDTSERLFEDRGVDELNDLQEVLGVLDQAGQTISEFASPSVLRDLEKASVLMEYSIAQVGNLADITTAYWASVITTVTGINADSVAKMIDASLSSSTSGAQAGRVFAETFEEQVISAIKSMAISSAVNDAIMPYLQPVMQTLVAGMIGGTMSAADMAGLVSQVKTIAANVAPAVSALYDAFGAAGISSYSYAGQADATSPVTLEARASGGPVVSGRSYIVGERRPEIFTPSSSGYISPSVPDMTEIARLLAEMKAMASTSQEVTVTIDGQQFLAWMEKNRLQTENRIAAGYSRTSRQVI